jgi:hypothetical protein
MLWTGLPWWWWRVAPFLLLRLLRLLRKAGKGVMMRSVCIVRARGQMLHGEVLILIRALHPPLAGPLRRRSNAARRAIWSGSCRTWYLLMLMML